MDAGTIPWVMTVWKGAGDDLIWTCKQFHGNDSVAPHNDKLTTLIEGHPIALVSLGEPRRMDIREKVPPRRVVRIDLEPGSRLVMSHAMQQYYDHGIPKTKHAVGPRISLAFRVRPRKESHG